MDGPEDYNVIRGKKIEKIKERKIKQKTKQTLIAKFYFDMFVRFLHSELNKVPVHYIYSKNISTTK